MILERKYGIKMNLKKITRIKREYNLQTKIRKKNKYQIFARTPPNILEQNFRIKF